ncbi:MAG: hypothetical protein JW757_11540 [Anaerolineales bacterium]|nr:hypothetical protein [Anaerolineales bacterium]
MIAENLTRIAVFGLPLLIPLQLKNPQKKIGLLIFTVGTLIYFGSWIPHLAAPQFAWSNSKLGLLTPRLTPLISLIGIAVIGNSWLYAGISVIFITLHTWHGIQNL